jgi:hypothetical protein
MFVFIPFRRRNSKKEENWKRKMKEVKVESVNPSNLLLRAVVGKIEEIEDRRREIGMNLRVPKTGVLGGLGKVLKTAKNLLSRR